MAIQSPPRDFMQQNASFFLPFLSPTVTPAHDDSDPYHELLFVPFQPPTKIDLGTCRLGQSASCKLNIFNPRDDPLTALLIDTPTNCPVQIETIRLPISERVTAGLECHIYHLPPNSSALLRITWTPSLSEDLFLSLTFKWGDRFTSEVALNGKVEEVSTKSRRVLFGTAVKASLGVTMNLSSSYRAPLRSVTLNSPCPNKPLLQLHPLIAPTPSQAFLDTVADSTYSFIASTPMGRNVTRPLITEQSFVNPSAIKRPTLLNGSRQGADTSSCGARRSLPFSGAGTGTFDSEWAEKQSRAFTHWLNYVLTPPDSSNFSASLQQSEGSPATHRSVINLTTTFRGSPPLSSPTDAVTEPQYSLTQRKYLSRLRQKSQQLAKNSELTSTLYLLHSEVDKARLKIRPERPVWKDVGLKEDLLRVLLSYHPLWLRLGLEAVFSCHVPVSHEMDARMLKRFLSNNLISSGEVSAKYSHRRVPGLFTKGYEQAIGKHIIFKFFALVLFLDMAKKQRLIDHDPCLFLKSSRVKCSKEMLLYFSRNFLQGEGDITKHLHNLGYHVSHKQSFLEEFDYKVTNLATDLRDGIRLSRLLELLTQDWTLSDKLRIPATSLTPRLANNKLFLDRLNEMLHFPLNVTNKDIAIGHRENTLSLIWALIFHFRVGVKIDEKLLRHEIDYIRAKHCIQDSCVPYKPFGCQEGQFDSHTLQLLLEWCHVIGRVFGLRVTDFTASFRDGRALCYIQHYYHPSLLSRHLISGDPKANLELFCDKMSSLGGIPSLPPSSDFHQSGPNEKVVIMYVAYLCAQQLELREEIRAAIVIQRAFKRYLLRCEQTLINQVSYDSQLDQFHAQTVAAATIQAHFRGAVARAKFRALKARESLISELSFKIANSFVSGEIDSVLSGEIPRTIIARQLRDSNLQFAMRKIRSVISESSVSLIQSSLREYNRKARKNGLSLYSASAEAANSALSEAGRILEQERLNAATLRDGLAKEQAYNHERVENRAGEVVEKTVLESRDRVLARRENAATIIQYWYREQLNKKNNIIQQAQSAQFLDSTTNNLILNVLASSLDSVSQSRARAATVIQTNYRRSVRAKVCRREFILMRRSAISLQSAFRRVIEKKRNYKFFSFLASQIVQQALAQSLHSIARNNAALLIQTWFRTRLYVRRFRHFYESMSAAARTIQRAYRSRSRKRDESALTIQSYYRTYTCVKILKHLKRREAAALTIQLAYRSYLVSIYTRERFLQLKISALLIQTWFRSRLYVRRFRHFYESMSAAARTIQRAYRSRSRAVACRGEYLHLKHASITIQRHCRNVLVARRGNLLLLEMLASRFVTQSLTGADVIVRRKRDESALTIQSYYRTYTCVKILQHLKRRETAALTIQLAYRNYIVSIYTRERFLQLKISTLLIQRAFRTHLVRLERSNSALNLLSDQTVAQTLTRSLNQLTSDRHSAALSIQSWYRMVGCRQEYTRELFRKRSVALVLQRIYRSSRDTALYRADFMSLKKSTVLLQRGLRRLIGRRRDSIALDLKIKNQNLENLETTAKEIVSRALLNSTEIFLESHRQMQAALTIQSIYRGYCVRRKIQNSSLLNIKRRLSVATNSAEPCQQLRNKIPQYIDTLLNARSLEQKYNILDKLKSAVYVSESCAIKLRQEGLDVLYMLVDNNVRSPSIIQRVEKAADVILQLAKWPSISKEVFLHGQSVPIITDVLQKIHATQPSTVRILSRLLIQFCAYPDQIALMHTYHHASIVKIHKCLMILKRKYAVGSKRMARKARKDLAQSIHELEAVFIHFRYAN